MDELKNEINIERQRYLLKPVVLCLAGPGFIYGLLIIILWLSGNIPVIGAFLGVCIMLFCGLAYWQNKQGNTRTSAYFSVLALFIIIYGGSYYFGISHALVIGYAIVAMLAGILIDFMAALFFALISMSAYLIIGQAQQVGILPRVPTSETTLFPDAIGLVLGLSALVIFLWLYERQMVRIMKRDKELNAKVVETNRLLTQELAERTRAEDEIKRKLEFEKTITMISSRFAGASDIDSTIIQSLGDIGSLCGAQHVHLCLFEEDKTTFKKALKWCADTELSAGNTFHEILFEVIPKWSDRLCNGELIHYNELESPSFLNSKEQEKLKEAAIFSMLIFPLFITGDCTGFISIFNDTKTREWVAKDITVLRVFSEIIGNSLTRKKLEEQLLHSQKMEAIGRLAGGVAHDFNNILTAIMGYSHLALQSLDNDDPAYRSIAGINAASERASSLTNQLLAFSRKQILKPEVLNLNTLISNMEKMIIRLIREDIEIVTKLSSSFSHIEADRVQIEQVIMNLAVNAGDAMPKGGKLTIETYHETVDTANAQKYHGLTPGEYVLLSVSDTGCGMDKQTQLHIFEPFFTTKTADKGTGLGLSTVYGIVKQSHGKIFVDSTPNQGTTFRIYLPVCEKEAYDDVPSPASSEPLKGSETILAVEDNDIVRELIDQCLNYFDYHVLLAADPEEAIRICKEYEGSIHLMLTDVVMPIMSGRELADQLTPIRPEMKVLYMSGFAEGTIAHHGILDSDVAFIPKPFTPDDLAKKIREVIEQPPVDN